MQGAGERARRKIEKCPLSSLQRMPADQTLLFKINNYLCSCLSSEIFPLLLIKDHLSDAKSFRMQLYFLCSHLKGVAALAAAGHATVWGGMRIL